MLLSRKILPNVNAGGVADIPDDTIFELPERVLQFGSGVLLRGLVDYFIDKANKQGSFRGRVVVVHSIPKALPLPAAKQDYLFTHCLRGMHNGALVERYVVNASISRELMAHLQWEEVMACADNPNIDIVVSNTTEAGIVLQHDDHILNAIPASFPGKLLALLYRRFNTFSGDAKKGWIILPTELVSQNGTRLKEILVALAGFHNLGDRFMQWLTTCNRFCNTLVDRIVPGKLNAEARAKAEATLGYKDPMMIMSEPYCLWAIEASDAAAGEALSFAHHNPEIVIAADIEKYKELKLRLLNGTHTFLCGLAILAGFGTVKAAMHNASFKGFMRNLMMAEIVPCVTGTAIEEDEAVAFAESVMERFSNPFIEHTWLSITLNYTFKMKARNVFLIHQFIRRFGKVPQHMALGFAAYILFNKCTVNNSGNYEGVTDKGIMYHLTDHEAVKITEWWQTGDPHFVVTKCLAQAAIWEQDLSALTGFGNAVHYYLKLLMERGAFEVIQKFSKFTERRMLDEA